MKPQCYITQEKGLTQQLGHRACCTCKVNVIVESLLVLHVHAIVFNASAMQYTITYF